MFYLFSGFTNAKGVDISPQYVSAGINFYNLFTQIIEGNFVKTKAMEGNFGKGCKGKLESERMVCFNAQSQCGGIGKTQMGR